MNTIASSRAGRPAFVSRLAQQVQRLAAPLLTAARHWWAVRQARLAALPLHQLDSHALRDLGLSRSEIESCCAEAIAEAERTRTRIAILQAGGSAP